MTLVELLVVLAIGAILTSVSIVALGAIRSRADQAKCASNLRQIGMALQAYADDHHGVFPPTSHTTGASIEEAWVYKLRRYMGDGFDEIRVSPADPKREARLESGGTSYILNSYLFVPEYDPFGRQISQPLNRPAAIRRPASTMVAFTISESAPIGIQNDHTHSGRWESWAAVLQDISPDLHRAGEPTADHTRGRSNYLFADWHVEAWDAADLKALIDSGQNPAVPPK